MIKTKIILLLSIFLCSFVSSEKMVKTKLPYTEGTVSVMLHESFKLLSDDDIAQKYPAAKKTDAAFTTDDNWVDFVFNIGRTQWQDNDIELFAKFNKATITTLYEKTIFEQEKIVEINGRKFAIYEFVAAQKKDYVTEELGVERGPVKRYYYLAYTIHKGKVLLFNFNCPNKLKKKWQSDAHKIISSIKVEGK